MKNFKSKEPKPLALILTAFSGLLLGFAGGAYLLLMKPVVPVSKAPSEELLSKPGNYDTYFAKGRVAGAESLNLKSGVRKIQSRTNGVYSFGEDEVNYYLNKLSSTLENGDTEGEEAVTNSSSVEQFNVSVQGDQMRVSFKLIADPKGPNRFEMLVGANVSFENTEAGPQLALKDFRVNSLPIPGLGGLLTAIVSSSVQSGGVPEELVEMWENIRRIELESDKLIVDVGLRQA